MTGTKAGIEKFRERLSGIKIIFMDVDGVLTEGSVFFIEDRSPRVWYVRDRLAIKILGRLGVDVVWISGRGGEDLSDRGRELGVSRVYTDIEEKHPVMERVLRESGLSPEEALYIGDDLIDLRCMEAAGFSCAPADAADEVLAAADYVSDYPGGRGAVRQIIELFLKCSGRWDSIVQSYRTGDS